jgi:hypothetical protein
MEKRCRVARRAAGREEREWKKGDRCGCEVLKLMGLWV